MASSSNSDYAFLGLAALTAASILSRRFLNWSVFTEPYARNLTGARATVVRILVRRFRCRNCGKTVSILPSFAQPYRLIQNSTIDRYFGDASPADALWWQPLLEEYWKKFTGWIPELARVIGSQLPRSPPHSDAHGWWIGIVATFGDLELTTQAIVSRYGMTLFGRYKCHSPAASTSGPD